jgi:Asp-tRNA(Asn)/Glu-tRNA(Gln) amidotransferase B subunit
MMLKIYDLKDPRTGNIEEVYDFPKCYLPFDAHKHVLDNCLTVSREPLKFPILVVPKAYLTEKENQRINDNTPFYLTNELAEYFYSFDENVSEEIKFNRFLAKIITQLIIPNPIRVELKEKCLEYLMIIDELDMYGFSGFVKNCFDKKLPWSYIKDIVEKYHEWNQDTHWTNYTELVTMFPCEVLSDKNELEIICETVLKENPKSVEDYRKGKKNSINHLKGQIMKLTKGKASASVVNVILERKLNA